MSKVVTKLLLVNNFICWQSFASLYHMGEMTSKTVMISQDNALPGNHFISQLFKNFDI